MDPPANGIVERHIFHGEQGAAGGGGAEAAQAESLRGGVGDERAGAAEELDAGQLAELAIEGKGGGHGQSLLRELAGGDRAFK